MRRISGVLVMVALALLVGLAGCGKKVTKTKINPGPPMTKQGFGAMSGTCSVCNTKSENLLSVTSTDGGYTAQVCGKDCGDKFRANPVQYGKKKE